MTRLLSLALLAATLGACASSPQSETQSLVEHVVSGRLAPVQCVGTTYCVTNGSRISANRDASCTCNPPAALQGQPIGR